MPGSFLVKNAAGEFLRVPLEAPAYGLRDDPARPRALAAETPGTDARAVLRHCTVGPRTTWVLLTRPDTTLLVNGEPVQQIKVLRHRDVLWWAGIDAFYYSTERPVRIEPFPLTGGEACCVRCKVPIKPGSPAVQCGSCSLWHHQDVDRKRDCWTYREVCAACETHPTDFDAGLSWLPAL